MPDTLKAPFPYFGGKSLVAAEVWSRFGRVKSYVEPFAGSLAVLLGRPDREGLETVNDANHYVANFWRALKSDPEGLAVLCDWPINETDLHARHTWLVNEGREKIAACYDNPDHYDLKVAAWWVWGISQWIGGGWCKGVVGNGRPHLARPEGIHTVDNRRTIVSCNHGISAAAKRPRLSGFAATGVHTKRPSCAPHKGPGRKDDIIEWFNELAARLRDVRVVCGDWKRITSHSVTNYTGICGMFLDPPYTERTGRDKTLYATDSLIVGDEVHAYALEHGDDPTFRIAVCGYEGEYKFPDTWKMFAWKTEGGFGKLVKKGNASGLKNSQRERIWFSPHCLEPQPTLF